MKLRGRAETIRFVTANYSNLQGLAIVPISAFLLIRCLGRAAGWSWVRGHAFMYGGVLVSIVGWFAIRRYYARHFGRVLPRRTLEANVGFTALGLGLLGLAVALSDRLQHASAGSTSVSGLFFVPFLLLLWGGRSLRRHYLWLAIACLGVSLLPATGLVPPVRPDDDVYFDWVAGVGLGIGGLLDHRALVRALGAVSETLVGQSV
jgi:hypothetical protein